MANPDPSRRKAYEDARRERRRTGRSPGGRGHGSYEKDRPEQIDTDAIARALAYLEATKPGKRRAAAAALWSAFLGQDYRPIGISLPCAEGYLRIRSTARAKGRAAIGNAAELEPDPETRQRLRTLLKRCMELEGLCS